MQHAYPNCGTWSMTMCECCRWQLMTWPVGLHRQGLAVDSTSQTAPCTAKGQHCSTLRLGRRHSLAPLLPNGMHTAPRRASISAPNLQADDCCHLTETMECRRHGLGRRRLPQDGAPKGGAGAAAGRLCDAGGHLRCGHGRSFSGFLLTAPSRRHLGASDVQLVMCTADMLMGRSYIGVC